MTWLLFLISVAERLNVGLIIGLKKGLIPAIAEGRGAKTLLKDYSEEVSKQLELHNRNLKNVLIYFEENHNIKISKKTLQNFLKDTGL